MKKLMLLLGLVMLTQYSHAATLRTQSFSGKIDQVYASPNWVVMYLVADGVIYAVIETGSLERNSIDPKLLAKQLLTNDSLVVDCHHVPERLDCAALTFSFQKEKPMTSAKKQKP